MNRKRMLIVDDEAIVHGAVRMILRRVLEIVDKMSAEEADRDLAGASRLANSTSFSGAMGVVYRAEDIMLQRPAALKMIEPEMAKTKAAVDPFFREARALARLRHDNVVQIYAFGKHELSCLFAMELVDGEDLDSMLDEHYRKGTTIPLGRTSRSSSRRSPRVSPPRIRGTSFTGT